MRGGYREKRPEALRARRRRFWKRLSSALVIASLLRIATIASLSDRECLYSAGADSPTHVQRLALMPSLLSFGLWISDENRRSSANALGESLQKGAKRFVAVSFVLASFICRPARPCGFIASAVRERFTSGDCHNVGNLSRAPPGSA